MSAYKFSSCLAVPMERFVDLRRLSGTDYYSQTRLLGYFDQFLTQQEFFLPYLTLEITDRYQQGLFQACPTYSGQPNECDAPIW